MAPRKKRHNIFYRIFIDSIPIDGGGYRVRISPIKLFIVAVIITGMLVTLQLTGALGSIVKIVQAVL